MTRPAVAHLPTLTLTLSQRERGEMRRGVTGTPDFPKWVLTLPGLGGRLHTSLTRSVAEVRGEED